MQDTETLTLPISKKTVIIKGYVSGLIDQEVNKVLMGANKARYEVASSSIDPNSPDTMPQDGKMIMETDPTAQLKADAKLLELMLVAVDGNNGAGQIDTLLDLPKADVDYVMARVKELQNASEVTASDPKAPQS